MKKTTISLLSLSELLDRSRQEIQSRFAPLFLLALFVPFATWLIPSILLGFSPAKQTDMIYAHPFLALFSMILNAVVVVWLTAALILYVCKRVQKISQALFLALKKTPRLLLGFLFYIVPLMLLSALGGLVSFGLEIWLSGGGILYWLCNTLFFLVVAACLVAVSVYFILLPYVLVLMEMSVKDCLVAAFQLVHHHFWRTLWLLIILMIITFIVGGLTSLIIMLTGSLFQFFAPASRYLFVFLGFIPAALSLLIFHIPLIAWYINLTLQLWSPEEQVLD